MVLVAVFRTALPVSGALLAPFLLTGPSAGGLAATVPAIAAIRGETSREVLTSPGATHTEESRDARS